MAFKLVSGIDQQQIHYRFFHNGFKAISPYRVGVALGRPLLTHAAIQIRAVFVVIRIRGVFFAAIRTCDCLTHDDFMGI